MGDHSPAAAGPLISVVTPCLNRARFVAEAVESVLRQGYPRFEHIVADGGSTDGTLEVLARYPHLRVISEPDRSLYDALNKGIRAARGDVIAHLNTDDVFPDGVFRAVGERFAADPSLDVVYGGVAVFEDVHGAGRVVRAAVTDPARLRPSPRNAGFHRVCTNARFFHRRVYAAVGLYDPDYKIAGDREFFWRLVLHGRFREAFLPRPLYWYRHHPGSLTFNDADYSERSAREHLRLAGGFLRREGGGVGARRALLRLHTLESLGLVAHEVRRGRWVAAARAALDGWALDPCWPVEFGLAGLRRLRGERTTVHEPGAAPPSPPTHGPPAGPPAEPR